MIQSFLNPIRLPVSIDPEDERALAELFSRTLVLRRRSMLSHQGEPSHYVKVVRQGFALRSKSRSDGERQIVGLVTAGHVCDLASLFFEKADHSVEAATDCEIAQAPRARVRELLDSRPAIATALFAKSLASEAIAHEWVLNIGRRDSRERIAHLICEIITCNGDLCREYTCSFPLIQADLADAVGLSIVQVNRVLLELRAEGLISLEHRVLSALNWERLCAIADFDPAYLH